MTNVRWRAGHQEKGHGGPSPTTYNLTICRTSTSTIRHSKTSGRYYHLGCVQVHVQGKRTQRVPPIYLSILKSNSKTKAKQMQIITRAKTSSRQRAIAISAVEPVLWDWESKKSLRPTPTSQQTRHPCGPSHRNGAENKEDEERIAFSYNVPVRVSALNLYEKKQIAKGKASLRFVVYVSKY